MNVKHKFSKPRIEASIVRTGRVTTASVRVNEGIFLGVGSSIRHEDDEENQHVGDWMAIGRALVDAGKEMTRNAHKLSNRKVNK